MVEDPYLVFFKMGLTALLEGKRLCSNAARHGEQAEQELSDDEPEFLFLND
jgi:hypothetical protein